MMSILLPAICFLAGKREHHFYLAQWPTETKIKMAQWPTVKNGTVCSGISGTISPVKVAQRLPDYPITHDSVYRNIVWDKIINLKLIDTTCGNCLSKYKRHIINGECYFKSNILIKDSLIFMEGGTMTPYQNYAVFDEYLTPLFITKAARVGDTAEFIFMAKNNGMTVSVIDTTRFLIKSDYGCIEKAFDYYKSIDTEDVILKFVPQRISFQEYPLWVNLESSQTIKYGWWYGYLTGKKIINCNE